MRHRSAFVNFPLGSVVRLGGRKLVGRTFGRAVYFRLHFSLVSCVDITRFGFFSSTRTAIRFL